MGELTWRQELSGTGHDRLTQDAFGNKARVDPGVIQVCCGNVIETQLAELRDRFGQTLFTAV